jgi:hypothetical protein
MSALVLEPTITAQWLGLIQEAESHSHQVLHEDLESYLVFLLVRFTEKPELAKSVLAMDYLQAFNDSASQSARLQDVGDKCLLMAGLFPERAERKRVHISYFVELGQGAYSTVADLSQMEMAKLYHALCKGFVGLMDILHVARELAGQPLSLMQAETLWSDVKSLHALQLLRRHTQGVLITDSTATKSNH